MYFDPNYFLFMIPGLLLGIWAQMKLSSAYRKYTQIGVASGLSGAEAAREILDRAGLGKVPVHQVPGHLTDHYDPRKRALFLSSENFNGRSLAAVGVAAHEAGHALQHQTAYAPLKFRMALVPVTGFASQAYALIFLGGMVLAGMRMISPGMFSSLIWIAIALFSIVTFFQIVTLPVEFDASRRAKERLLSTGIVSSRESDGISRVLSAAALTYVAAMVSSILQLLYLLTLTRNRN
ncbi:MAG: zinc metallopeptidase [Akkermansiaceae bacterium]|nr:zinc metallopeptidase [Verrucomicrobiales bacterium]